MLLKFRFLILTALRVLFIKLVTATLLQPLGSLG